MALAAILVVSVSHAIESVSTEMLDAAASRQRQDFDGAMVKILRYDLASSPEKLDRTVIYKQLGDRMLVEYEYPGGASGVYCLSPDYAFQLSKSGRGYTVGKLLLQGDPEGELGVKIDLLKLAEPVVWLFLLRHEQPSQWLDSPQVEHYWADTQAVGERDRPELRWRLFSERGESVIDGTVLYTGAPELRKLEEAYVYVPTGSETAIAFDYDAQDVLRSAIYANAGGDSSSDFSYRYEIDNIIRGEITESDFTLSAYGLPGTVGRPYLNLAFYGYLALAFSAVLTFYFWRRLRVSGSL